MQPKPKPESLDDLLANAEHYANFSMRNMGRMPPTLFLIGANGSFMFIPDNLADEHAKDEFRHDRASHVHRARGHRRCHGAGSMDEMREAG
jgi:hypothetical protein